jgi:multidrug efflux pump subunit AcrA (membrane-fusion protein)
MKILYTALLCALAALTVISINLRSDLESFHGIADTKEMVIRAEFGVEIKKMRITPGQRVFTGDTLVEMRSPEIELKISEYTHLVNEMRTRSKTQANLSKAEMKALKSEQEARIIEIRSELQQLESQYAINRELIQKLRSVRDNDSTSIAVSTNNPTLIRIQNLKEELARLDRSTA